MARIVILGGIPASLLNFRRHLLEELVRNGHDVFACAPGGSNALVKELAGIGVHYRRAHLRRSGINPFEDFYTLLNLVRIFRSIKPDVFLGYTVKPVIFGSLAARLTGVRKIYTMITGLGYAFSESSTKARIVRIFVGVLYRIALRYNHGIFFQNPDDRQLFLEQGLVDDSAKAHIVNGSGIDITLFSPQPFPKKPSYLLIARLLRDKGIVEYVKAAEVLRQRYPGIKWRLVGMFDENPAAISKQELDKWIATGAIEYLGALDDVRPALADCAVYVLPSYREGTPRTVLEAMSMGRPIITTDVPGCRETVKHGLNGYLIPVRDVSSLVSAMESFLKNPEKIAKMGAVSRKIALEKYDVRKVTASMLNVMNLV